MKPDIAPEDDLGGMVADVLNDADPHDSMTYRGSIIYRLWERLVAESARADALRIALEKIERQTSPAQTVCSQWGINEICRAALAAPKGG